MKKLFITALIVFSFVTGKAQDNGMETLFGGENFSLGGYGGPEVKFTNINNEFGLMVGGRGGFLMNSVFTVGIAGYGLVTSHKVEDYKPQFPRGEDSSAYLRLGYGGLHFGFNIEPNKLVHITTGVIIGGGAASYTTPFYHRHDDEDNYDSNFKTYETSAFFIVEPQVGAEVNLLKFMRMEVSGSYRFVSGINLPNTQNSDLSGFSGNIMFKFGKF